MKSSTKKIRVLFVTNILSSHQVGLWDEFAKNKDFSFVYLCTRPKNITLEKRYVTDDRDYCVFSHEMIQKDLSSLIRCQDFIVVGSVEDSRVYNLIRQNKNLFFAYENLSKIDFYELKRLRGLRRFISYICAPKKMMAGYNIKDNYVLCASSHTKMDFRLLGLKHDRAFRFGYFPHYNFLKPEQYYEKDFYSIIYVGRDEKWKHPEIALEIFKSLYKSDNRYHLEVYGDSSFFSNITIPNLHNHGYTDNKDLLKKLSLSGLFIFPSDRREGWGVVLAEAMAAGCIVFANSEAGSTQFLVNKHNGFVFKNKLSIKRNVRKFLKLNQHQRMEISLNAISSIKNYTGLIASDRLAKVFKSISENKKIPKFKDKGPLSII